MSISALSSINQTQRNIQWSYICPAIDQTREIQPTKNFIDAKRSYENQQFSRSHTFTDLIRGLHLKFWVTVT